MTALKIERDENSCRKAFTPSELVAMRRKIEGHFKDEAKERQGERTDLKETSRPSGLEVKKNKQSEDAIAEALGTSRGTLRRATKAVNEGIPEVIKAMDKGEISIAKAAEIASVPKDEQKELLGYRA